MNDPAILTAYDQGYEITKRHQRECSPATCRMFIGSLLRQPCTEANYGAIDALADLIREARGL